MCAIELVHFVPNQMINSSKHISKNDHVFDKQTGLDLKKINFQGAFCLCGYG